MTGDFLCTALNSVGPSLTASLKVSVKEFPKKLLLRTVPDEFDILCTHPMFGPDSGKGSWEQGRGGDGDRSAISPENDTRPGLATSSRAKSGSGAESNN